VRLAVPRFLLCVLAALVVALGGCATPPAEVPRETSTAFSHDSHLAYFASGSHRQEKIAMHLEIFGATEAPEELVQGKCSTCHDGLSEMACGSCHVAFQQASMRAVREARPCIGCHRGAWAGTAATLPRPTTCVACHDGSPAGTTGIVRAAHVDLAAREYAGGVRVSSMPANVYFSHRAHVRFGGISCARCHTGPAIVGSLPAVPAFSMTQCLQCHVENGASTDCLTCHK
jgi:menaquinone reductase, multiheme cytochrome c subunit